MEPVPFNQIEEVFRPILAARLAESNLLERSSVEYTLNSIEMGYRVQTLSSFVDNLESPSSCLIICQEASIVSDEKIANMILIWVKPELRTTPQGGLLLADIMKTARAYGEMTGCDILAGASWEYQGAESSTQVWEHLGFEKQEVRFIKKI